MRWGKALLLAAAGYGAYYWLRRSTCQFHFRDKTILITGGSRGLGLVIARQLAEMGARVAICARDIKELERAEIDIATHGERPLALPCDITDPAHVKDLVRAVQAHFGPIDVLINNAATISVGPLSAMNREDFENTMNVNFWGAYNMIEAVLPEMRERGQGHIVNIASIGGKVSVPHMLPYSASKFALVGYSDGLRAELANHGIVVTTVCPGLMRTGSPRNAIFKGQHEQEYAWFSISDSMPLLTISAERAACQILDACRHGDAEVILSVPAKIAIKLRALFPELTSVALNIANRLLPRPGDHGNDARRGSDCQTSGASSFLTQLTDEAAVRNNEGGS